MSEIESAPGVNEILVNSEPSTAGIFADPSNCKILFAVVPTSTFSVAEPVVAPPVKPVPATTAVISPDPAFEATNDEPFQLNTCPDAVSYTHLTLPTIFAV